MSENRFGEAVALLLDAVQFMNNQSDMAKRINAFLETVHPLECGPMAKTDVPDAIRVNADGSEYKP